MIAKAYEALGRWLSDRAPWKVAVLCQCELYGVVPEVGHKPVLTYACDMNDATKDNLDWETMKACLWLIPASVYAAVLYAFKNREGLRHKPTRKSVDEWRHEGVESDAGR